MTPSKFTRLSELADVLEAQFDLAGLDRAHIAGNSLGGALALEMAGRGRALSVVAFAPAGAWLSRRDTLRMTLLMRTSSAVAANPLARRVLLHGAGRRHLLRTGFARGDRIPTAELAEILDDMAATTIVDGLLATAHRDGPFLASARYDCPVRIAWPSKDRTIPFHRWGAPLLELIEGAELIRLSGVGHVPMHDDPELVARTILEMTTRPV